MNRTPYKGWGSWYNTTPQTTQSNVSAPRTASGGNDQMSLLSTLLGYLNNPPATPGYESVEAPSLPSYAQAAMPSSLQAPTMPYYAGASIPAGITAPELPSVGGVSRPGPLTNASIPMPQLQPGTSLAEMAQTTLPYQSIDFASLFGLSNNATPIASYDWWRSATGSPSSNAGAGVSSGVNPMPAPSQGAATLPAMSGGSSAFNQAAGQQASAALQPAMMQNAVNYHQSAADYRNNADQAVARSGLDWANLAQLLASINARGNLGRQSNVLGMLGGMI